MKPEDIPMDELKTFALDFAEEGDLDGVKRAIDAVERAAFKAAVDSITSNYQRFEPQGVPLTLLLVCKYVLEQLDKEATDGEAE